MIEIDKIWRFQVRFVARNGNHAFEAAFKTLAAALKLAREEAYEYNNCVIVVDMDLVALPERDGIVWRWDQESAEERAAFRAEYAAWADRRLTEYTEQIAQLREKP